MELDRDNGFISLSLEEAAKIHADSCCVPLTGAAEILGLAQIAQARNEALDTSSSNMPSNAIRAQYISQQLRDRHLFGAVISELGEYLSEQVPRDAETFLGSSS